MPLLGLFLSSKPNWVPRFSVPRGSSTEYPQDDLQPSLFMEYCTTDIHVEHIHQCSLYIPQHSTDIFALCVRVLFPPAYMISSLSKSLVHMYFILASLRPCFSGLFLYSLLESRRVFKPTATVDSFCTDFSRLHFACIFAIANCHYQSKDASDLRI